MDTYGRRIRILSIIKLHEESQALKQSKSSSQPLFMIIDKKIEFMHKK